MTRWTSIWFTEKRSRARAKEGIRAKGSPKAKAKAKPKGKGKGKGEGKNNEQGKSAGKGMSSRETFRGTCRNRGKTGHKFSECWAKGGGAAKHANDQHDRN